MSIFIGFLMAVTVLVSWLSLRAIGQRNTRIAFIDGYTWPPSAMAQLARTYPELSSGELAVIGDGLKQFFQAYLRSGFQFVSMPSQAADELWHAMIVDTRAYKAFCDRAFGRFLHHKPAITLTTEQKSNAGLRRVWWQCCKLERLDPSKPKQLPLLFDLDQRLKVPGGYKYSADCAALRAAGVADTYCGGDFSSSSFDGGTAGFGDGASSHGGGADGSADSGGGSDGGGGGDGGGCGGGGGD